MKKVAVIGGTGMVASRFIDLAKDSFDITSLDEKTLDITQESAVTEYFEQKKFDTVINFAAYTNVDGAEKERGSEGGITYKLNVLGPEHLAKACNEHDMFFIHISTDFVFTGTEASPGPYSEDSELPETSEGIGWYGWTKNRAEFMLKNISNKYAVIRYGYPFRAAEFSEKLDWARNLIKLYNDQKLYPLFTDQVQSILFIDSLVEPMSKIINEELTGNFHIASKDAGTPYEIGKYLLEKYAGKGVSINKGSMIDFLKSPGRTPRPILGGLKVENTETRLKIKFGTWKQMVDDFIFQIKNGN